MEQEALNGRDYVATRRLSVKGRKGTAAEIGATCERIPKESLPWLIERGWIVKREKPARPKRRLFSSDTVEDGAEAFVDDNDAQEEE